MRGVAGSNQDKNQKMLFVEKWRLTCSFIRFHKIEYSFTVMYNPLEKLYIPSFKFKSVYMYNVICMPFNYYCVYLKRRDDKCDILS